MGRGAAELGLSGEVTLPELRDVLRGRQPGGAALTARPAARRREGWDLVIAAPKSISLLALSDVDAAAPLRDAFRGAVADAVSLLEQKAARARRLGAHVQVQGLVAACYEHVHSAAGQPHLHAHVVVPNLARAEGAGKWSCLVGNELWRWREAAAAVFHLCLREGVARAGFSFDWVLAPGGAGEIADAPKLAKATASSRSLASRASALRFGSASGAAQRVAKAKTRGQAPGREAANGPAQSGLGQKEALGMLARARSWVVLPAPPPASEAVEAALAARCSTFDEPGLFTAVAETSPSGSSLPQAVAFVREWLAGPSIQSPAGGRTTPLADRLDREVIAAAAQARPARLAIVSPAVASAELDELGFSGQAADVGAAIACSGHGVSVLPRGPWLAQAACADAARSAWQAAGVAVGVLTPTQASAGRWRALTSLRPGPQPDQEGAAPGWGRPGRRALFVDAADHLSPVDLAHLTAWAASSATKVVLVPGGTVSGSGSALARSFDQLVEDLAPEHLGPPAALGRPGLPAIEVDRLDVRGALTGSDAMAHMVAAWASACTAGVAVMAALGPAEAVALNAAARDCWLGKRRGCEVVVGARAYAARDKVLSLRRLGAVPSATLGTIVEVLPGPSAAVGVEWLGRPGLPRSTIGTKDAEALGHAYATTRPYLRAFAAASAGGRPGAPAPAAWLLGDPGLLRGSGPLLSCAYTAVAGPGRPAFGPPGLAARRRAAVRELAASWPDGQLLDLAGPRPLEPVARSRWASVVAEIALQRDAGLGLAAPRGNMRELHERARRPHPPRLGL